MFTKYVLVGGDGGGGGVVGGGRGGLVGRAAIHSEQRAHLGPTLRPSYTQAQT